VAQEDRGLQRCARDSAHELVAAGVERAALMDVLLEPLLRGRSRRKGASGRMLMLCCGPATACGGGSFATVTVAHQQGPQAAGVEATPRESYRTASRCTGKAWRGMLMPHRAPSRAGPHPQWLEVPCGYLGIQVRDRLGRVLVDLRGVPGRGHGGAGMGQMQRRRGAHEDGSSALLGGTALYTQGGGRAHVPFGDAEASQSNESAPAHMAPSR
jgi:hypothetical protein